MSEPTLQDCINYMRSQIKQMEKHPRNYEFNLPYYRKTVELLEKAQRPHGKWTSNRDTLEAICSVCGEALPYSDEYDYETNFCPNCGADMRKKRDGMNVSQTFVDEWIGEQQHGRDGKEGNVFTRR